MTHAATDNATALRTPDFLVIGAMKAGTTALCGHLAAHPELFITDSKEPHYFGVDEVYARGATWYADLFREAPAGAICGEGSTTNAMCPRHPLAHERIARDLPDVKLIYLLRHPVERAYSHYVHRLAEPAAVDYGFETGFLEAMQADGGELLGASDYMGHIDRYLDAFPRERLLVLLLDDLTADRDGFFGRIAGFLGVDRRGFEDGREVNRNAAGSMHARATIRGRLRAAVHRGPWGPIARVVPASVRASTSRRITRFIERATPVGRALQARHVARTPPLTEEARRFALDRLAPTTNALARFLDRDLSAWMC